VSWTSETQTRLSSHCNMNININSAADSRSLHRGTGEPARSTSHPDCSAELWKTYHNSGTLLPVAAQLAKASKALAKASKAPGGHFCLTKAGWHLADQRKPSPNTGTQHSWIVQERWPPGRGSQTRPAIATPRQHPLIFFLTARPTDRPPPPTNSDPNG
jgi:hypothetical protein